MSEVVFRRINGRVVPVRKSKGPDKGLAALSIGAQVASGIISGLTLTGGARKLFIGQSASLGLDAGSVALNAAAHKNMGKGRNASFAKNELISSLVGYTSFGATALAYKPSRDVFKAGALKTLNWARKLL